MEQGRMARAAVRRYREKKKKEMHEAGEIKHIRGLLKSGPRCLSIIRLVGEIHASTADSSASGISGGGIEDTIFTSYR